MSTSKVDASLEAVKQLLAMFKLERMVYLAITLICLLILIAVAIMQLTSDCVDPNAVGEAAAEVSSGDKYTVVAGLVGSSGGIVYTAGRLLKMWSEAMRLIQKAVESND